MQLGSGNDVGTAEREVADDVNARLDEFVEAPWSSTLVEHVEEETAPRDDEFEDAGEVLRNRHVNVFLMGDSVLDDFFWLDDHTADIEHQLSAVLNETTLADERGAKRFESAHVVNLALDESQTQDILVGKRPGSGYASARERYGLSAYPVNERGVMHPLDLLEQCVTDESATNVVVLSVGGNDARVLLHLQSGQRIIHEMKRNRFDSKYSEIVTRLHALGVKVILVLCYEPHESKFGGFGRGGQASSYVAQAQHEIRKVIDFGAQVMMAEARKFGCPIIDLSKTFNPGDRSHYGSTSIEPSNKSGWFICRLIDFVLRNDDYFSCEPTHTDLDLTGRGPLVYYGDCDDIPERLSVGDSHASKRMRILHHECDPAVFSQSLRRVRERQNAAMTVVAGGTRRYR